jgi:hypothetical protein
MLGKGFTKLIRHAVELQMLQSTENPADSSAYPNADESALNYLTFSAEISVGLKIW